jgi:hypothetical protein
MSEANERQIAGDHYMKRAILPWDFVAANDLDFFQGTIIKHVVRWKDKLGLQDLLKAQHYLEKYIEVVKARQPPPVERKDVLELLSDLERCHLNLDTYENTGKALQELAVALRAKEADGG